MDWFGFVQAVASVATAIGVGLAALQLRQAHIQARTQFEDEFTKEFRDLVKQLPLEALLGEHLDEGQYPAALPIFYRYMDLCNEQAFLRWQGRVSRETWKNWSDGMRDLFAQPEFERAWSDIAARSKGSFKELRLLHEKQFKDDPFKWSKDSIQ